MKFFTFGGHQMLITMFTKAYNLYLSWSHVSNFVACLISTLKNLLATYSTPTLEDHPLSAVRDCLLNIFAVTLHIWGAFPSSTTWGFAMLCWQGTLSTWSLHNTTQHNTGFRTG